MMDDMTLAAIAYDGYRTIPETIKGTPHVSAKHFSRLPFLQQRAWAVAVDAVLKKSGADDLIEDMGCKIAVLEDKIEDLEYDLKEMKDEREEK